MYYNIFDKIKIIIYNVFGDLLMYTIKDDVKNEIIINKSKFITFIFNVKSIDDIDEKLSILTKEYKEATHICYAYILGNLKKASDDGEPSHTAGMPILNVLENKKLNNVLAVVVRYFGGIKLGAGGLVRAYSNSTSKAIDKGEIVPIINEIKIRIEFDYNNTNNINYILKDHKITYKEFDNKVIYEFTYDENNYPKELDNYITSKKEI